MTVTETPRSGIATVRPPDDFFRLAAGLYVAALVAPAATIVVALGHTADPGVLYSTLLGVAALVTVATAWLSGYAVGVPERLGRSAAAWGLVVLPFGYFLPPVVGLASGIDPPSVVVIAGLAAAIPGAFVGIGLVAMAHNRYTKAVLESATERARFRAAFPERERRLVRAVAVALMLGGFAGLVAAFAAGIGVPYRWIFQSLPPFGAVLFAAVGAREFAVTDAGLVAERPLHRSVRPWAAFAGYSLTDVALVIRRRSPWRPDVYCAAGDIDDVEAVDAALAEFLGDG